MYLSDAPTPDWQSALLAITNAYAQKKLIQAQSDRIRAGQQPVELPQLQPNLTPVPVPTSTVLTGRNDLLIAGAVGLAVVGAFVLLGQRRRR